MTIITTKLEKEELFKLDTFFKRQFSGSYRYGTMGYFFWKIFLNPFREGFVNLIKNGNDIAATTSITPKSLVLNQKLVSVAEIGDTYTDSLFQGRGYFSTLVNESCVKAELMGIELVYGTPNNQSLPAYLKKTKFKNITLFDIRSFNYLLRVDHILLPKVGRLFADLIDSFFRLLVIAHSFFLWYQSSGKEFSKIEHLTDLPLDWDDFWNDCLGSWDFIFCRDVKSMSWRFFSNPEKYSFLVVRSIDRIVGYVVYKINSDLSQSTLVIADFLFLEGFETEFNSCLKLLRKIAIDKRLNSISLWCDNKSVYRVALKKSGFIVGSNFPVIFSNSEVFKGLGQSARIHFTLADSDNV
jgi:hypothetical protein